MISQATRQLAIELVNEAVTNGARRSKACAVLEISVRTLQRWMRRIGDGRKDAAASRIPANRLSEAERAKIIDVCNEERFRSLPPSQIVPLLADESQYLASESSFYRVLREVDQIQRRGRAQAPRQVTTPQGYQASAPNQVWSWDITYLAGTIRGMFYRLYMMLDIYSRKIVAWEVHETETAAHAAVLIQKACLSEKVYRPGLVLHADNGAPMKAATMLATLQKLGVIPSFSRPSVSDDNPYSESLFRTLKYTPAYPCKPFASLDAARAWVMEFVHWYNHQHRHSGIQFVTPAQRHAGTDRELLERRKALYEAAKRRTPARWSGPTRNWAHCETVWLNPPKGGEARNTAPSKAA